MLIRYAVAPAVAFLFYWSFFHLPAELATQKMVFGITDRLEKRIERMECSEYVRYTDLSEVKGDWLNRQKAMEDRISQRLKTLEEKIDKLIMDRGGT